MDKKIIFSIYLILLGCLYVMNQLHLILINGYINYAIGILLIVMLITKVPFLSHNLSSSKDIEHLSEEQENHEFMDFKTFFILLIPLIILSFLTFQS